MIRRIDYAQSENSFFIKRKDSHYGRTNFTSFFFYGNSSGSFIVLGIKIFISNEELANAIAALSSLRQEIILMSFFIGLNDREIGDIIGKSLGGVWYQRQVALEELGKYLGGNYEAK